VSYAVWWIRQSILSALSEHLLIRLPLNRISAISKVKKSIALFQASMDREPSIEELSGLVGMKERSVIEALHEMNVSQHVSLDAPVSGSEDGDPLSLYSMVPEQSAGAIDSLLVDESMKSDLNRVLESLPERQCAVVRMHFGLGCSPMDFEVIACSIFPGKEVSAVYARMIFNKGIDRLKNNKDAMDILKKYLG
jgi:RNA polymerase primary sigma factor